MEHDFKNELIQMDHRLTEMEEKIDSIDKKLNQVVDAILGNSLTKSGGFIDDINIMKTKIEVLEKKQSRQEDFKKRIIWTVGIVLGLFVVVQYILNIYTSVIK